MTVRATRKAITAIGRPLFNSDTEATPWTAISEFYECRAVRQYNRGGRFAWNPRYECRDIRTKARFGGGRNAAEAATLVARLIREGEPPMGIEWKWEGEPAPYVLRARANLAEWEKRS